MIKETLCPGWDAVTNLTGEDLDRQIRSRNWKQGTAEARRTNSSGRTPCSRLRSESARPAIAHSRTSRMIIYVDGDADLFTVLSRLAVSYTRLARILAPVVNRYIGKSDADVDQWPSLISINVRSCFKLHARTLWTLVRHLRSCLAGTD